MGSGEEGDRALDPSRSMLRPRVTGSRLSPAMRLVGFRLEERLRRLSEGVLVRDPDFILLPLLARDCGFNLSSDFSLLYRASSSGDMETGEDGDRFGGWIYRRSFRPRVS